jgi:hypothetical protein
MTAEILKVSRVPSKFGGDFFYIFFKADNGKSYRTCTAPKYRNFKLWRDICLNPDNYTGSRIDGLQEKTTGHFDADYQGTITRRPE